METTTGQNCLEIKCAYEKLAKEVEDALKREHFTWTNCSLTLILDQHVGFALKTLLARSGERTVVVTDNPCPEYWEDLWDLQPQILLAGGHSVQELANALIHASKGERYRKTPHKELILTRQERSVLRYCAMGLRNQEIAEKLQIKESAVKSYLYRTFAKLNLEHRTQAVLYYWGLRSWFPSEETLLSINKSDL